MLHYQNTLGVEVDWEVLCTCGVMPEAVVQTVTTGGP